MDKIILTREQLYDLVWSTPMIQLAKKYNISDNGLRKICKRMNIPTPDSGYWTKLKFNKPVKKVKLPKNFVGENEISLSESNPERDSEELSILNIKKEIEEDKRYSLQVPQKLINPDKRIEFAKEFYKRRNFEKNEIPSYLMTRSECIDLRVTSKNLSRAFRIMDTFIKAIKARGHEVSLQSGRTAVVMYTTHTDICLIEKSDIVESNDKYGSRELIPNGKLAFKAGIYYSKEWVDNNIKLEDKLSAIIAWLEYKALKLKKGWDRLDEERRIQKEEEQKEKELQEIKDKELKKFKKLLNESKRWRKAKDLREYIQAIEENSKNQGGISEELRNWLQWAMNKANWYDPFINKEDHVLGCFEV